MTIHPELVSVAQALQAAAQTILNLAEPPNPDESSDHETEETARQAELRHYHVPFHALDEERELLSEYNTDNIADVLDEIHTDFFLMLELMKGYAEQFEEEGLIYSLTAEKLLKPLGRLRKVCSVLVDFKLESKEPAEHFDFEEV